MSALPPLSRAPQTLEELGAVLAIATRVQYRTRQSTRRLSWLGFGVFICIAVAIGTNLRTSQAHNDAQPAVSSERVQSIAGQPRSSDVASSNAARSNAASTEVPVSPAVRVAPPTGVTPEPASLLVLVDKERHFPPGWMPAELVAPNVDFTFSGEHPKRLMHPEAAAALEAMFESASQEGVALRAASGFRSESTQADLFSLNQRRKGPEAAAMVSARPGHSEHQSGLAMDVAGASGTCVIETCFGDTVEFAWLVRNAAAFGFIVRYPLGAEPITGYLYEPWHLRYVGSEAALDIVGSGKTLEQWLGVR